MQKTNLSANAAKTSLWKPKRVLFTPKALSEDWGQEIHKRVKALDLEIEYLPSNRLNDLKSETYSSAKHTMAVVTSPPSHLQLKPIPPSADWQFHLAEGCPAHCQYCYLAGSLQGPPIIRVFANLNPILFNLKNYLRETQQSFEVSCYTDPLALEHLTGSLSRCIEFFGQEMGNGCLRWVSKFASVEPLMGLRHNGKTRCRFSLNAEAISARLEGGTASVPERIMALRRLAYPANLGGPGYKVGVVLAPIMPIEDWPQQYTDLLKQIKAALNFDCDLTFELITHRFTPGSKEVLLSWYPNTKLDLSENQRTVKRNKFGGFKYVYEKELMADLKSFFYRQIAELFPEAKILYWT